LSVGLDPGIDEFVFVNIVRWLKIYPFLETLALVGFITTELIWVYFILGRLRGLIHHLPFNFIPKRILDFGCEIGDTTKMLSELFPEAEVVGFDTFENCYYLRKG
jgi:SAM-dependent methyltransferase